MADEPYTCWGEDHEDLTAKVELELAKNPGGGIVIFRHNPLERLTGSTASGKRKVKVVCSKGHENVFEFAA